MNYFLKNARYYNSHLQFTEVFLLDLRNNCIRFLYTKHPYPSCASKIKVNGQGVISLARIAAGIDR